MQLCGRCWFRYRGCYHSNFGNDTFGAAVFEVAVARASAVASVDGPPSVPASVAEFASGAGSAESDDWRTETPQGGCSCCLSESEMYPPLGWPHVAIIRLRPGLSVRVVLTALAAPGNLVDLVASGKFETSLGYTSPACLRSRLVVLRWVVSLRCALM